MDGFEIVIGAESGAGSVLDRRGLVRVGVCFTVGEVRSFLSVLVSIVGHSLALGKGSVRTGASNRPFLGGGVCGRGGSIVEF